VGIEYELDNEFLTLKNIYFFYLVFNNVHFYGFNACTDQICCKKKPIVDRLVFLIERCGS